MSLTSIRFSGVQPLEDCAVSDAAHLLAGSSGSHVALVQQALMDLGYDIPDGATGFFGAQTGAAVFAYKTDRGIFAPGATVANPIVGKGTIKALDAEIEGFDQHPPSCFEAGDPIGTVALDGVPAEGVNGLLGLFGLGPFLAVAHSGEVGDLTADAADASRLLAAAAQGASFLGGMGDAFDLGAVLAALAPEPAFAAFPATQAALVAPPSSVLDLSLSPAAWLAQFLQPHPGPLTVVPARDLTFAQALSDVLVSHAAGEITLTPDPTVTPPAVGGHLGLVGNQVAGVSFLVANSPSRLSTHPAYAPVPAPLRTLDPRHLVGLIRLCRHLASTFGVTELHHIGVNGDAARLTGDCHQAGRACDLIGLRGVRAGTPFLVTVLDDWGGQSVPDLAHPGKRLADWPHVTMPTRYRLTDHPTVDPLVRDLWQDLYTFLAGDFQDTTQGPGSTAPRTAIGQPSSIMTPDHPRSHLNTVTTPAPAGGVPTTRLVAASDGREAHRGHVHFQIGVTGVRLP